VFGPLPRFLKRSQLPAFDTVCMVVIVGFLLYHLRLPLLMTDTMSVGGDLPAHNYMASHVKESLLGHGRIISWAPGWWCGFPLFQYYFFLPYAAIAVLSVLIPFNIAFKLICVAGVLLLPVALYLVARLFRFPRPTPILFAMAAMPILFVKSHTMWGVNLYSTLSGMISNSISFPLMLLALASAYRDVRDGRFRLRTVILMASVLASHFFTSIMLGLAMPAFLFVAGRRNTRRSAIILAQEGVLTALLMSWWLIPLFAKKAYSVDFGTNWDVSLWATMPFYLYVLLPLGIVPLVTGRSRVRMPYLVLALMLGEAVMLFLYGYRITPVFVNVRLWPFVFSSLILMITVGLGLLLRRLPYPSLLVAAVLIAVLSYTESREAGLVNGHAPVRGWAEFNFSGLENKPRYSVFKDLVLPLKGTPGRLANDLTGDNNAMGSSRIFECIPHLIGKPILEGGLVNSAIGSYFSYYVQGETSQGCAGFPTLVRPTTFDMDRGSKHLALFNVKHFIAKWERTKAYLRASPDWRRLGVSDDWELFELITHDGKYVTIPENCPVGVVTEHWEKEALEWIYRIEALDQQFVFLSEKDAKLPHPFPIIGEADFAQYLERIDTAKGSARQQAAECILPESALLSRRTGNSGTRLIESESVRDDRIRFTTKAIGQPHLVKCSYFPNWKVRGADRVYLVPPDFMLVYPTQANVEIYYGAMPSDWAGWILTGLGGVLAVYIMWRRRRGGRS
jgi:hypothetical protein